MTSMTSIATGAVSDTEYVMSRVFNAPREIVYRACTDAALIPEWWGQRATTTVVDQFDLRIGGTWRFIQKQDDGVEYAFRGEFVEIVPNEKLVMTFEFEPMPGHVVTDSHVFEDVDGGTRLTTTSIFATPEDLQGMLQSGMEAGASESWDQLAELVERLAA